MRASKVGRLVECRQPQRIRSQRVAVGTFGDHASRVKKRTSPSRGRGGEKGRGFLRIQRDRSRRLLELPSPFGPGPRGGRRGIAEAQGLGPASADPVGTRCGHEQNYVEHLEKAGLEVVRIGGVEVTNAAIANTLAAMHRGVPVIVQAAMAHQGWKGRAFLV